MYRLKRVGLALLLAVFLSSGLIISSVRAQEQADSISLGISPQLLDLTANPGESVTSTFRLTNASVESVAIKTTPKNFTPRGEEGAVDLTEDRTSFSIAEWISVKPSTVTIEPSKTQDFVVTIAVPGNAEPGSHFGSVVFQTIPPEQEGSAALVSQEIAPVILMKIAGDISETAEIEEFRATKSNWSNESTISLISRLKNTGSAHFKPTGQIVIKNMFGHEVAKLDLDKKNVLPDSIRQITTDWQSDGFRIGKYTAELTVVYGDNDEIRTASTSFIIFPYQTVVPILIVLLVVGLVAVKGRKRLIMAARILSGKDSKK